MFGRNKQSEDDPFAALKADGTYKSTPTDALSGIPDSSTPVAQAPPASIGAPSAPPVMIGTPSANPSTPQRVQRRPQARATRMRSQRRRFPFWIILPVIAVLSVIAAISKSTSNNHPATSGVSVVTTGAGSGSAGSGTATGSGSGASAKSKGPTSYLTSTNLSAGLARVEKMAPGSKLLDVRIDAMSLDATVIEPHGVVKSIDFGPYGTFVSTGASTGSRAISFSSIHVSVVPRLISELHSRFHVGPSHINYMVAFWFPGLPPFWGIYLKAPSTADYQASLTGAGLHLNS